MDQSDPKADTTAQAIAFLTARYETPGTVSELEQSLYEDALIKDDGASLLIGMMNVVTWLLVKLENATGQTASEILQDIARKNQAR
jgi:hypothetical protein